MRKSQNHLILKSTQLWEGAADPEVGPVLTQIGLDDSKMERLKTQTLEFTSAKHQCAVVLSKQKESTVAKKAALKEARRELADLAVLFRLLYRNSSYRSMLTMNVIPQTMEGASENQVAVGSEGEETGVPGQEEPSEASRDQARASQAQATIRGKLTQALANLDALPQEVLDNLADFGWDEARIAGAREKLEAYKAAYAENKKQVGLYHEHVKETRRKRMALEQIYRAFSYQIRRNLDRFENAGERLKRIAEAF